MGIESQLIVETVIMNQGKQFTKETSQIQETAIPGQGKELAEESNSFDLAPYLKYLDDFSAKMPIPDPVFLQLFSLN